MCRKMKVLRRQISPWVVNFLLTLLVSQGQMWPQNFAGTNVRSPTIGDNRLPSDPSDITVPSSPRPTAMWPISAPRLAPRASARPPSGVPHPRHRDEEMRRPTPLVSRAVASSREEKHLEKGPSLTMAMNRTAKYGRSQQDAVSGIMELISSTMQVAQLGQEVARRPPAPGGDVGSPRPQWNQAIRPESRIREKPDDARPNKTEPTHRGNVPQSIVTNGKRVDRPVAFGPSKPVRPPDNTQIVFPGQPVAPARFVPTVACAGNGRTFCESTADYPAEHLARLLDSELATRFGTLFGADEVDATNITQRFDSPPEDETLCQSVERVIYPTAGQTRDEEWRFIVNQEKFLQGVRIETCLDEDSACMFGDNFPFGYRSFCKQKFIYRKLVSLKADGSTTTDDFKLPACCSCHVRNAMTSMRMASSDVTPVT